MKQFLIFSSVFFILLLSACGVKEEVKKNTTDEVPEIIEVELTVPETGIVGEEVTFTAAVTQGEDLVDDASEVKFEVLNINSGAKEMIEASLNNDKHYTITHTFETNGTYEITSHVTARDMHTMPSKQITVTGDEEKVGEARNHSPSEGHHAAHGVTIDFKEDTAKVGEAVMLVTNVSLENAPLEDARIQYEIFRSDSEHHTWIEAPENDAGVYQTEFTFTESGTYEIEVHVTKGNDIHDHVRKTYIVK